MNLKKILARKTFLILTLGCAVVALAAFVTAARTWRTRVPSANSPVVAQPAAPNVPQRTRPIADFESELVTITPHGFEPQEITRPQGRFLLMVDNRSGLSATSLALTREAGPRTHEMHVPREEPNWSEVVNLPPGRYVLSESDHPRWTCRITITAQ